VTGGPGGIGPGIATDPPFQGLRRNAKALAAGLILVVGIGFFLPDLTPPPTQPSPVELLRGRILELLPPSSDPLVDPSGTLVESIGKKARFLEAAVDVAGLGPRVTVVGARAETLAAPIRQGELEPFDVVTARAVGALPDLVRLAFPLLGPGGRLVAWKRGDIAAEIKAAARAAMPLGGARITVRPTAVPGLEGHVLVVIEKPAPRGLRAPRGPRTRC